jgi:uncharacterized protein (TIGR03089 family)
MDSPTAVPSLIAAGLPADPSHPLITYYDDATGERTDLSAADLGTWAARTATLLARSGLGAGSRAAVLLAPHWQTAAVLLGAWSAGVSVAHHGWATAGLPPVGAAADVSYDVTFVALRRLGSWLENVPDAPHRFVLGLDLPLDDIPEGYRDFLAEVRAVDDAGAPPVVIGRTAEASPDGTTYRQWGLVAAGIAESSGIRRGDRVLVDAAQHENPAMWLLAPLSVGASIVLCANLDPALLDARMAAERITQVW